MSAPRSGSMAKKPMSALLVRDRLDRLAGGVDDHELDGDAEALGRAPAPGRSRRRARAPVAGSLPARIGLPRLMEARSVPVGAKRATICSCGLMSFPSPATDSRPGGCECLRRRSPPALILSTLVQHRCANSFRLAPTTRSSHGCRRPLPPRQLVRPRPAGLLRAVAPGSGAGAEVAVLQRAARRGARPRRRRAGGRRRRRALRRQRRCPKAPSRSRRPTPGTSSAASRRSSATAARSCSAR